MFKTIRLFNLASKILKINNNKIVKNDNNITNKIAKNLFKLKK